jgi:hypothetical protein
MSGEKKFAEEHHRLTLFSVKELIDASLKIIREIKSYLPVFMRPYCELKYLERLEKLEEKYPGCYISDEFDRDEAYERGIYYEVFEGDL